jgi:hypothetical protein
MQRFGVKLGVVFTASPYNKRGNRENARIMALNEEVLAINGGGWDNPVSVTKWSEMQRNERDAIISELTVSESAYWGFKDPRTLLTLPFWLEAIEPEYIGTFRHPIRVAQSLNSRSGIPLEQGLSLWFDYNQRLLKLVREFHFPVVNFDLNFNVYIPDALTKLIKLGLDSEKSEVAADFFLRNCKIN